MPGVCQKRGRGASERECGENPWGADKCGGRASAYLRNPGRATTEGRPYTSAGGNPWSADMAVRVANGLSASA